MGAYSSSTQAGWRTSSRRRASPRTGWRCRESVNRARNQSRNRSVPDDLTLLRLGKADCPLGRSAPVLGRSNVQRPRGPNLDQARHVIRGLLRPGTGALRQWHLPPSMKQYIQVEVQLATNQPAFYITCAMFDTIT